MAKQLLDRYRQLLFDQRSDDTFKQQRAILVKILELGESKMATGQEKVQQSSGHFNNASGKLRTLHSRFTNEFDSKSTYYQGQVNKIRTEAWVFCGLIRETDKFFFNLLLICLFELYSYAGAAAGAWGGPLGLLIFYSIAAGIVEGQKIPELNEKLR